MKKVGFLAQQLAEKREEFDKLNATIIAATNVEEPRVAVAAEPQSMKETHYNTEFLDGASPGLSMQIIVPKAPVTVGIPLTTPCVPQLPPGIPIRAAPRFPPGIPIPHAPLGIPVGCTPRFPPGIPIQPAPPGITIPTSPCAPPKIAFPCLPLPPAVGIPFNIGMIQYHGMVSLTCRFFF